MKLILIITLLVTSIFASNLKFYEGYKGKKVFFGNNKDIPQITRTIKSKIHLLFNVTELNEFANIIDKKNHNAWTLRYKPISYYTHGGCTNGDSLDINSIKTIDLNLLKFMLKKMSGNTVDKDFPVWVRVNGLNRPNKVYANDFKVFSLTKNKYLKNIKPASFLCKYNKSNNAVKYYWIIKNYEEIKNQYTYNIQKVKQKDIDTEKRKTIQVADECDQGLILEIKGPLVNVQVQKCTMYSSENGCIQYSGVAQWLKRNTLTFENQK